ncbi:histidine phosphatase family protein [Streptomyces sp. NPDC004111]|uniref:histidine phosphatase family protein n=1 Tax=Streptomyces sp. NPDC004111 TaxID=3364690 RepID=UPI0036C18CCA
MDTPQPRYLYIARHAEATDDETALTGAGRRQAALLGRRLRDVPFSAVHHGPLARTTQTARLVAEQLDRLPADAAPRAAEHAGDYVPYEPVREDFPDGIDADRYLDFVAAVPADERARGTRLAEQAVRAYTGPVDGSEPRHELLVTHNFLAAHLVRAALDAPDWRWLGLNFANAALTVIRYAPGRPDTVLLFNDTGHLPAELRWTGFPPELHI